MKKLVLTLTLAISALLSFAQIPQTFSYQGVVRDAESKIVAEKPITVSVQILQGTDEGAEVYAETHEVTTNANGLMTFELGSKNAEDFAKIDWSNAPYFVKTIASFDGKQISGVTPLLAVPYALYAAKAGNADVDLSNYALKSEIPAEVDLTDYAKKSEIPTDYVSTSALNTAIGEVEAKIPAATDLSGYYSKEEIDALLAALESKIENGGNGGNQQGGEGSGDGYIQAAFSISANEQIYFSQGNLQYQASTGTWRFAEHQYDMIGSDNSNISSSYSGWIDLFGWGTSGYNGKNPYMTSTNYYSDYGDGYNDIAGTSYDWGVYNKISNGGNSAGMWRTLTYSEWNYVISNRTDARFLRGTATVNGVNGLILLPDNWTLPTGVTFTYGEGGWSQNTYSASEWSKMEANGAVFLPAAGLRDGTDVGYVGSYGDYWSSSANDFYRADYLYFGSSDVGTNDDSRAYGQSVRLVRGVE
ncbi:MAG: hypothetical protein J6X18_08660 [Bacteroidales bacterium]|nr:hypothetical protein [Bacteroidales bacterium]